MDTITLDVSALPDAAPKLGDFVELLGPHQSVEQAAEDAGTISYANLTRLGSRYDRLYVDGSARASCQPVVAQ